MADSPTINPFQKAGNAMDKSLNGGKTPAKPPSQEERTMREYIKRNGTMDGPPSKFGFGARRIANFLGLYGD